MIRLGLAGSIAAGKSTVAQLLRERGAFVVDADREAHAVYAPAAPGFDALLQAFGPSILAADGAIDRRQLASIVFADPDRLQQLNAIVWPLTRRRIESLMAAQAEAGTRVFVVEAPLLIEAGWRDLVDEVWLVTASRDVAVARLAARGLDPDAVAAR